MHRLTVVAVLGGICYFAPAALAQDPWFKDRRHRLSVEFSHESFEEELKVGSSENNIGFGSRDFERDVVARADHSALFLGVRYAFAGIFNTLMGATAEAGLERISLITEVGSDNQALGTPAGSTEYHTRFDDSFAVRGGIFGRYTYEFWDFGIAADFRAGGSESEDATREETYDYRLVRVTLDARWQVRPELAPFAGLRYVGYDAEHGFAETDVALPDSYEFGFHPDLPLAGIFGVRFDGGGMIGTLELQLADDFGYAASVLWKF